MSEDNRGGFKTNLGTILALAGSAVGLGSIWRFPYMVAENGGSAFILIYILMVFLICVPAFMSEMAIGRSTRKNIFGAFRQLAPGTQWQQVGVLGILVSFVIASFYSVIGGWTLAFLVKSAANGFAEMSPVAVSQYFEGFVNTPLTTAMWTVGFVILSVLVLVSGVAKGIERYNKILMPTLLVIMILMVIKSLTLENSMAGLEFIFKPDFSAVDLDVVLAALGQAFFSMSLGMGAIITYGSYARKQDNMLRSTVSVAVISVVVALLAGMMIFPAVFSFNIPAEEGSQLAFVTFPGIFQQMPGGYFFSIVFFLLLLVAAVTSNISLLEVVVAYLSEEFRIKRRVAILLLVVSVSITASMCAYSLVEGSSLRIGEMSLFAFLDDVSASYLLPISALLIAVFVGWVWKKDDLRSEISSGGLYKVPYFRLYRFMAKFIIPILILLIFLYTLGIV